MINEENKEEEKEPVEEEAVEIKVPTVEEKTEASGDTLTPNPAADETSEPSEEEAAHEEKMLTQSQVNALVGKARQEGREAAMRELLERYGVNDDSELNDLFGRGQAYNGLNDDYMNQENSYKDAMTENALLKARVVDSRWDDIKSILNGKGLDVTVENIEAMIPTHPEWRQEAPESNVPGIVPNEEKPATLRKLGNEASPQVPENEEAKVKELFGM